MQYNFTEITLRCSPVNLLHIFRMPFYKNTSGRQLLYLVMSGNEFHNCASSDSKLLCLNLLTFRNENKEQYNISSWRARKYFFHLIFCPLFSVFFCFTLPKESILQIIKKCFLFHLKIYFCSRDNTFVVIFPFLSTVSRLRGSDETGIIMLSWIGFHKLANLSFWNNSETTLY